MNIQLIGDTDLILRKKALSFEREEVFKQSHTKGTKIPDKINSKLHYNIWEKLITSITWKEPIRELDMYEDYTEEMWKNLMKNNAPCILSKAFIGSFKEVFITFGYRDSTGKAGTDFSRSIKIADWKNPVDFASVSYSQHLTPNNQRNKTNVLSEYNIFSGWRCDINVIFFENVFPKETILEIISNAGELVGIGTKRAEGFGMYHIGDVTILTD